MHTLINNSLSMCANKIFKNNSLTHSHPTKNGLIIHKKKVQKMVPLNKIADKSAARIWPNVACVSDGIVDCWGLAQILH